MSNNRNHTGTSMCGTIIYRNQKPMKEKNSPVCYFCGHYNRETGYCSAGDVPFLQEDITIAERCRFYTGKKPKSNGGYAKYKDKKGNYSYKKTSKPGTKYKSTAKHKIKQKKAK